MRDSLVSSFFRHLGTFRPYSLKMRITLTALLVILAGFWSLSIVASHLLRQDMERVLSAQQFSTTTLLAAQINDELESRIQLAAKTARAAGPTLQMGADSVQTFIDSRIAQHDLFNGGLFVVDRQGHVIADSPQTAGRLGTTIQGNDAILAALHGGKSSVSKPGRDPRTGAPFFTFTAPIFDDDLAIIGALSGVVDMAQPNFLDQITDHRYGETGHYQLIAPRHQLIVTSTHRSRDMQETPTPGMFPAIDRILSGEEKSFVHTNPQGIETLISGKRVPATDWQVVTELPTDEAFAPIREMHGYLWRLTAAASLIAFALIGWMLRRQLAPLQSAAQQLSTLPANQLPQQIQTTAGNDEVGQLISRFNNVLDALRHREDALRESEASFRNFFEKNGSVMILTEPFTGEILLANEAACLYYGYARNQLIGMSISAINTMAPAKIAEERLRALHSERNTFHFIHRLASGDLRDVEVHLTPIEHEGKKVLLSIMHDITERKLAEEKLHLAASVFSHAREGILITRADGTIIDINDSFTRITGYERADVIGRNPRMLNSGRQPRDFYTSMWNALQTKGHWYGELWNQRKNGELFAVLQTISVVLDSTLTPQHYVSLFSDITALKEHAKQLEHIAHYDVLTTLPNRVLLADRMKQAMIHAARRGELTAVAYLDLDGFKTINDLYGHEIGDRLLITLAEQMKQPLRGTDTLARIGGDEFIAVLCDLPDTAAAIPMLMRLLDAVAKPISVGDLALQLSASIGVTFYPQNEDVDAEQLLRQADQAMYQAKLAGKNRYHFFDAEQDRNVRGHHESLEHIRRALLAREFVLHYQPKVNMRTGEVIGAEALIRWQHPERGLLHPGIFLPIVEDHPLAIEIGEWVIESVLTQIERWQATDFSIAVSVNVGGRQLLHGDFAERIRSILLAHPTVAPERLEIEVLETSALEDLARVSKVIEDCRKIGISFALDDFGTGYSSLTYLKRLAVNELKIDQSFVRDMLDDPDDLSILGGVLSMATAFRRQVIAEGVESIAHGTMLLQLGCELAQGYGIARPMPAAELPRWAANWRPDTVWSAMKPASRDDLPLLFASVEHRAWFIAVEDFLHGRRSALPLAHHQCRFSEWLANAGHSLHHDHPAFADVVSLHDEIHKLANHLCDNSGKLTPAALSADIDHLHALRDALLAQLQLLIADNQRFAPEREFSAPGPSLS